VPLTSISVPECPVSYITSTSQELVQLYARSKILSDAGVTSKAEDIPIVLADAFVILSGEAARYESHMREAEERDRQMEERRNPTLRRKR
jgi:hypothetical protein